MRYLVKGKQYYFSVGKHSWGVYIGYTVKKYTSGRIYWFKPIKNDGFLTSENGNVGFSIDKGEKMIFEEVTP